MTKFFNTLFGLLNGFIVMALGLAVLGADSMIEPPHSYILGTCCLVLGLCGIIYAYVGRFKKVEIPATTPKKKK